MLTLMKAKSSDLISRQEIILQTLQSAGSVTIDETFQLVAHVDRHRAQKPEGSGRPSVAAADAGSDRLPSGRHQKLVYRPRLCQRRTRTPAFCLTATSSPPLSTFGCVVDHLHILTGSRSCSCFLAHRHSDRAGPRRERSAPCAKRSRRSSS